ncbi:hypothetical protein EES43_19630 [Streptomyces sp. ADI96-02]|uniref:hypothetical protein n=1 Tax=unclassified Streptomyces TaxID=2593676 RepID=UPI000F54E793|nr:hypothetical protein [Streptomyces sp. ADI96-02]RPK58733.1 hypothetical protein EES43_19630 [Streptomyces sp. ADI96-02]
MTSFAPAVRNLRRTALALVLCGGLTAALTACAGEDLDKGTNGVAKLSAEQIDQKARAAADGADAVRLAGTLVSKGGTYLLNMRLNAKGGVGSVSSKKRSFALLRIGDELYLKADAEFWSHEEGGEAGTGPADEEAADKLGGKYVKVPEGDPSYGQLRGFTDKKVLLDGLLALHGTVNKGSRATVAGHRTIQILGGKGEGGALDVSLEDKPYPMRVARGGGGGTVSLADWGRAFDLEPPAEDDTVDYGGQLPKSSG